jgi:type III pantothenate kinase
MKMLLTIDIGNTNVVIGIFERDRIIKKWRLSTHTGNTRDEYSIFLRSLLRDADIKMENIQDAAMCSVVPALTPRFEDIIRKDYNVSPVVVRPGIKTGLKILYEPPQEVGADRIVNSVGGFNKYGGPLIIVDFGTATTFDVVSRNAEYMGGVISPGPGISSEALARMTARLPKVDLRPPKDVIGRSTIESIRSGLYYGHVGSCDRIIERISENLDEKPSIIATGGLAETIAPESRYIQNLEPDLTLEGLKIIYNLNSPIS